MLPGIRLCCCWSKLWRVSPRWPASNPTPLPTPHACGQCRDWRSALGQSTYSLTSLKGEPFHCLCSRTPPTTTTLRGFWGAWAVWQTAGRPGFSHKAGKAAALPYPLPLFPISECGGRQTGVTYQHDIVQARFSLLPQSNENFNCITLCFFFNLFPQGTQTKHNCTPKHAHSHTEKTVRKSTLGP